ncbi:glutaminase [Labrys sp. KNU-23]|nr:glutaminase [Labrys sp. KNU-23]
MGRGVKERPRFTPPQKSPPPKPASIWVKGEDRHRNPRPALPQLDEIVAEIAQEMASYSDRGEVATYIPELARVDPAHFGIAVIDAEGNAHVGGDSDVAFSIQSISKVFTLTLALGKAGDRLWRRVGREPSGSAFNSIVQLENEKGIPRNPFINAGAIAVTDLILSGHQPREALGEILHFMRFLADDPSIAIDEAVAASEQRTGFRNAALANYMKSFGVLDNPVDYTLGVYFHHCAIAMSCRQLAMAGRFLALHGLNPSTGYRVVQPERARRINAIMLTCGHYDGSGEFAYRVGLPGKSGVGGGILAVAPGKASIAVWAPGLDANGNSHLGRIALETLTRRTGWSIFGA